VVLRCDAVERRLEVLPQEVGLVLGLIDGAVEVEVEETKLKELAS